MKIRFASRALREINEMADYYLEHSPQGGVKVERAIKMRLRHLRTSPLLGRQVGEEGVRRLVVPKYPYKIFYRIEDDTIEVLSVFHTSRDPRKAP